MRPQQLTGDLPSPAAAEVLWMEGIRKAFDGVVALDGVDFGLREREVHGLLGGNGAGKTTLMNVLYGLYRPDAGTIRLRGEVVEIPSPRAAIRLGIGMVHQHFLQVETYTVTENIVLGTDLPTLPALNLRAAEERVRHISERFGLTVEPNAVIEDLPVGARQRVEILKALYRGARLLILDEPTTNLTPQEVDALFGSLRAMVDEGMSIVFITHKIREALGVCERLTVMRDGRMVEVFDRGAVTPAELVRAMVGEALDQRVTGASVGLGDAREAAPPRPGLSSAPVLVEVRDLAVPGDRGPPAIRDCSLTVRSGEVLGIAGVAGNGQVELAEALAGVRQVSSGRILVDREDLTRAEPDARQDAGVVYIPENRHRDALLPGATLAENLILGAQDTPRYRRGRFLDWRAIREHAETAMREYRIRATSPSVRAGTLSGGNIQRLVLARAFARAPRLLVAHNPTRGLDIASAEFVYERLQALVAGGAAVILLSDDLDELRRLSDRIAVLFSGRIVAVLDRDEADPYRLGRLMSGMDAAA